MVFLSLMVVLMVYIRRKKLQRVESLNNMYNEMNHIKKETSTQTFGKKTYNRFEDAPDYDHINMGNDFTEIDLGGIIENKKI